jgi:hypothetical protein
VVPVLRVGVAHRGGEAVDGVVVPARVGGQGAAGQVAHAVAHEGLVRVHRMGGEAVGGQHRIHGVGDVVERIKQGSIQVEYDGVEAH